MRLLLDTHVLLWWLSAQKLSPAASAAIASVDSEVYVSAATVWEMSIKASLGKLDIPDDLDGQLARQSFDVLPIGLAHALAVRELPPLHADPFDRLLVAQARVEGLTLVSRHVAVRTFDVPLIKA